jgi:hypothetical protein
MCGRVLDVPCCPTCVEIGCHKWHKIGVGTTTSGIDSVATTGSEKNDSLNYQSGHTDHLLLLKVNFSSYHILSLYFIH